MNEDLHRIRAEKLERKGLKKLKKLQATQAEALKASDATVSTLDVNGIPASSIPKADDAAKLTKKKKRKQQPENGNVESQAEPEGEKVKKKKKKHLQPEAAPQIAAVCAAGDKPDGLQKPKQKNTGNAAAGPRPAQPTTYEEALKLKKKKLEASGTAKGASLAEVGDQELARTGQPVQKALYSEHPAVTQMSEAAVQQWRKERETAVTGCDIKPVTAFDQAGFSEELLQSTRGFAQPSPIQAQCWPIIQSGHDLVGIAATGSGKTLAFGLPGLTHILAQKAASQRPVKGPFMLVLAPTRELAQQIAAVLEEAGAAASLRTLCAYGGVPKPAQAQALRKGVDVLVATPGRLEDLMNDGACKLSGVTYVVLDEADRMLDLGFEPHIRAIVSQTRADRQTLMFSATWPPAIQKLASQFLADPARVTVGSQDLSASHSVKQVVEVLDPSVRDRRLDELLRQYHASRRNRILVFVLYKKEASRVEAMLAKRGWKVAAIHGDISQQQRSKAVETFKSGTVPLLVATDVAARGLDIPDVEFVINYSFPLTAEDYVHRIGRTGRAGKTGVMHIFFSAMTNQGLESSSMWLQKTWKNRRITELQLCPTGLAHTFFSITDKPRAGELINVLREAQQPVPEELLKFGTTVKKKESKLYGAHFKEVDFTKKATKVSFDSDDE